MDTFKYSINISWSASAEAYIAIIPEFNNLSAMGDTHLDALREVRIALCVFLKAWNEENKEDQNE